MQDGPVQDGPVQDGLPRVSPPRAAQGFPPAADVVEVEHTSAPRPVADPRVAARPERADVDPPGEATEPQDWEAQIAHLLRRPENLRCVHQPIVDLRTGDCLGYEAFTRVAEWPAASPEPWFRAAARAGLAAQFEVAALMTSLRGRAELPADRFLTVNMSPATLAEPVVIDVLARQGDLHGLLVDLSDVEGVLADPTQAAVLAGLRGRGLMAAVDVLEGGRTELDLVSRLRPDIVRLDRTLIAGSHTDPVRQRVVRQVVDLAGRLDVTVLAEGVEVLEDARYLQFAGVGLGQGWLFGRARPGFLPPSAEVAAWLQASWEETSTLTRVGRLAVPVGAPEDPGADRGWSAQVQDDGRLRLLVSAEGELVEASTVVRVRASHTLRQAAARVVAAGPRRRPHGLVAVVGDDGRFVGLTDVDTLLGEVFAVDAPDEPTDPPA